MDKNQLFHRNLHLLLLSFALLLICSSGHARDGHPPNLNTAEIKVQLKWKHQFQFAGYYAAELKGYYKEAGLKVHFIEGRQGVSATESVLSGKADFGVTDSSILTDFIQGKPVVVVAAIFQHSPYILLSRRESNIRTPSDLIGKRVMLEDNQGAAQLKAVLLREGIKLESINIIPQTWDLRDLINGKVDAISAYLTAEPNQLQAQGIEPAILNSVDYGVDFYGDTLFTSRKKVKQHPEQVEGFLRATQRGWKYAFEHKNEIIDHILTLPGVKARGITRAVLEREADQMEKLVLPDVVEIGHMNPGRWQSIAASMASLGMVPEHANLQGFMFEPQSVIQAKNKKQLTLFLALLVIVAGSIVYWSMGVTRREKERTRELNDEVLRRKQLQSELEIAQQRLDEMLRVTAAGIAITNSKGQFLMANPAFCDMLGYTEAELQETDYVHLTHPEDHAHNSELANQLLDGKIPSFVIEKRYIRKNQKLIWVRASIAAIRDNTGMVSNMIAVTEDISSRKAIEEKLRQNENLLKIAGKLAQLGGWALDLKDMQMTWSDEVAVIHDMEPGTIPSLEEGLNMYVPEARERICSLVKACAEQGIPYDEEFQKITAKNRHIWVRTVGEAVRNADGEIIRIQGAFQDITKYKNQEIFIRKQSELLDKAQDAIIVIGMDQRIQFWNKGAERLYGWTAEEVLGQIMAEILYCEPEIFMTGMQVLLEQGEWTSEVKQQRKDGSLLIAEDRWTLVRDDFGESVSVLCINTDITERKAAAEEIQYLAFYDPLTKLPNRQLLQDRLNRALANSERTGRHGALLFIDLDNFKTINDTLGHASGDMLLQQIARRLSEHTRTTDTVARLGGDEFIIMLEELSQDPTEAASQSRLIAEKLIQLFAEPFEIHGHKHHSSPSVGITLFQDHHDTVNELLKRADLAMYQAKAAGRNTLRFYDPQMQTAVSSRVELETDMRQGLEKNEFFLHYQPQIDIDGTIIGVEALVRWKHSSRGMISPAEFIPLAEETRLILPIGEWVLLTACKALVSWQQLPAMARLTVAVNVSVQQFRQPDFVEKVLAILTSTGAPPQKLKLELTESLFVESMEDIIEKMSALKTRGVGFSLDDFGTGYSSLSYLKRLPLDQLKIDQSFVQDVLVDSHDATIARSIISLAKSLGLEVIAEGVEQEEQRAFLQKEGCFFYQGYLFSKPLPEKDLLAFVSEKNQ